MAVSSAATKAPEIATITRILARSFLAALPDPAWIKDSEGRYLAVNAAFRALYERHMGRDGAPFEGRTDLELFSPEAVEAWWREERRLLAAGGASRSEQILRNAQGELRRLETHRVALLDESGQPAGILGIAEDVTEGVAPERLRESERKLAALVQNLPGMAYRCCNDPQWTMEFVSAGCRELTGRPPEEFVGNAVRAWHSIIVPEDRERVWDDVHDQIRQRNAYTVEYRIEHADGSVRWVWERGVGVEPQEGRPRFLEGFIMDITDTRHYLDELVYRATHDTLTGLANRPLLVDHLKHGIAYGQRYQCMVAALVLNIDKFKYVNESLGHDAGDDLLKEIAARLKASLRQHDTVSRIGADSFAVVLIDQENLGAASQVMTRILNSIREPVMLRGQEVFVTCSMGCALYPNDGDEPDTLLRRADAAMRRARELGGNCFHFYSADIDSKTEERLQLEANLRRAVSRGELFLQYQPQISLADGTVVGMEALVRWKSPKLGVVSPGRFIPTAEETDLIVTLGDWILEEACRQTKKLLDEGFTIGHVAVNLSARQFRDRRLVARVSDILRRTGLDPSRLELEITEGVVMYDIDAVIGKMKELKALGVLLSIDDFGTGYSSLSYLRRFPIDRIKIDQSFTREIESSPDAAAIARAVIDLGRALGLRVIAEGVEREGQLRFLRASGCHEIQGYIYARPLDPAALRELLAAGPRPLDAVEAAR
jgi:diguanylate cyclase (GGDEF)-like protein/PAS domain S-box-containing protein